MIQVIVFQYFNLKNTKGNKFLNDFQIKCPLKSYAVF
jgi:hypothetical protein